MSRVIRVFAGATVLAAVLGVLSATGAQAASMTEYALGTDATAIEYGATPVSTDATIIEY